MWRFKTRRCKLARAWIFLRDTDESDVVCSGSILELEVVKAVHSNAGMTIMWWHPGESILCRRQSTRNKHYLVSYEWYHNLHFPIPLCSY
ncbi:hypothetical protein AcW1_007215 [Taiwanofungus camphoratus]|nr:hypothetical protein AcW1_007215 [Antrodia cinnamomea]